MMLVKSGNVAGTASQKSNEPLPDARVIWGRTLLSIKKDNKFMLHTVCVGLGELELVDRTLKVKVPSRLDYEVLKKPQNFGEIVDTLAKLGYNVDIEFVLDESAGGAKDKVGRLKAKLGVEITVK